VREVTGAAPNPWFSWDYVQANWGDITEALGQHVALTVQAVAVAAVVALPLALVAHRRPRLAGPVLGLTGVLYTIPSLALFAVLYPLLRDRRETVLVGLVMYALLVLVRNVLVGLQGVDPAVVDAARGLGMGPLRTLLTVELPNALPAVVTGLRLATVTTVALATIGVVVGYGGLGQLMYRGFNSQYRAEIVTATLLTVALALVADAAWWLAGRLAAPWARAADARGGAR
jgi:osmoprotectant transport system permease protein